MIKKICTLFIVAALLCCVAFPAYANTVNETASSTTNQDEFQTVCVAPDGLFPFIYSTHEDWQFWRDYVGECDCEDGYLYVKNTNTGVIIQVLADKVRCFLETCDYLYCITEKNEIVKVSYSGSGVELLYSADSNALSELEYYAGKLYFIDGEKLVRFDLAHSEYNVITPLEGIVSIFAYDADKLLLTDENGAHFSYDISCNGVTPLNSESEVDQLINPAYIESEVETADVYGTYALPAATAVTFPLPSYPVGSYFTDNGGPCSDHKTDSCLPNYYDDDGCNCKLYGWSAQCMGFARYASDQYAHLTFNEAGSTRWLDARGNCTTEFNSTSSDLLTSASEVREIFDDLTTGAYVRLQRSSSSGHSFVIVSKFDTEGDGIYDGVITYDCNNDGQCGVSLKTRTYASIASSYKYIKNTVSHDFSEASLQYSATYHKIGCSNCNGYILSLHYTTSSAGTTCDECGYVGRIPIRT